MFGHEMRSINLLIISLPPNLVAHSPSSSSKRYIHNRTIRNFSLSLLLLSSFQSQDLCHKLKIFSERGLAYVDLHKLHTLRNLHKPRLSLRLSNRGAPKVFVVGQVRRNSRGPRPVLYTYQVPTYIYHIPFLIQFLYFPSFCNNISHILYSSL
ncbi:hypothetical protein F5Y11DRAFT_28041 [Daldinia sp. FL1419]|nr:hypothetical protein F5Y11DRAFT_28041 [Daldinia sp. FL1419]